MPNLLREPRITGRARFELATYRLTPYKFLRDFTGNVNLYVPGQAADLITKTTRFGSWSRTRTGNLPVTLISMFP